jgi:hypothetical protein
MACHPQPGTRRFAPFAPRVELRRAPLAVFGGEDLKALFRKGSSRSALQIFLECSGARAVGKADGRPDAPRFEFRGVRKFYGKTGEMIWCSNSAESEGLNCKNTRLACVFYSKDAAMVGDPATRLAQRWSWRSLPKFLMARTENAGTGLHWPGRSAGCKSVSFPSCRCN